MHSKLEKLAHELDYFPDLLTKKALIVIVPGDCRPDPKGYLAFSCDIQFQSPVRVKPVRRLIKLEIDQKDIYPLGSGLQPPGTNIILAYNQVITGTAEANKIWMGKYNKCCCW